MKTNIQKAQLIFVLLSVLMAIIFIFGSLIPYIQMNKYHSVVANGGNFEDILETNFIFNPQTPVTSMACTEIISRITIPLTKKPAEIPSETKNAIPFLNNVLIRCGTVLEKSTDPVDRFFVATVYDYLGHITNDKTYFDKSDALIAGMFEQSPKRQPFVEFAGVNFFFKRDFVLAKKQFTEAFKANPNSRQAAYYLNTINSFGIK